MTPSEPNPEASAISLLYSDFRAITDLLATNGEPSLKVTLDGNFRKALLLASASRFEVDVCDVVLGFAEEIADPDALIPSLVQSRVIKRKYHDWFDWDSGNANKFFGMFGPAFRRYMAEAMKRDEALAAGVSAFMDIGSERNRLVHIDYANYPLEKTTDEIYALYESAQVFIKYLPQALRGCSKEEQAKRAVEKAKEAE